MELTDEEQRREWELKISQTEADIDSKHAYARLKDKQALWETPRAIAAIMLAFAAVFASMGGYIGFLIGRGGH